MYRVLIVDDEFIIRDGLSRGFDWEKAGFRAVSTASDGLEALEFIEQELPDLVLTDIKMPGMDGMELIKNITLRFPQV